MGEMRWGSAEHCVALKELSLLAPKFPEKSMYNLPSATYLIGIVPPRKSHLALLAVPQKSDSKCIHTSWSL